MTLPANRMDFASGSGVYVKPMAAKHRLDASATQEGVLCFGTWCEPARNPRSASSLVSLSRHAPGVANLREAVGGTRVPQRIGLPEFT